MAFPTALCESSALVNATSEALTRKSKPALPTLFNRVTFNSSGGYAYFGMCFLLSRPTRFTASLTIFVRSGAVRIRSSPKLVTKLVLTIAPLAYSIAQSVTSMCAPLRAALLKIVRFGANRKNGISRSR